VPSAPQAVGEREIAIEVTRGKRTPAITKGLEIEPSDRPGVLVLEARENRINASSPRQAKAAPLVRGSSVSDLACVVGSDAYGGGGT
jgi:hypothetical protein